MHQQRSFSAAPEPSEPSTSTPSESKVPEVYAHFLEQKNYKAPPLEFPVRHLRHYKVNKEAEKPQIVKKRPSSMPPASLPSILSTRFQPKPKSKYTYDPWPEGIEPIQTSELVPEGVTLTIERSISQQGKVGWLTVSGPLGSCNFSLAGTAIKIADGQVHLWGVERGRVLPLMSKIKGAFDGVRQGYVKGLQLQGIGYKVEQKASDTLEFRIGKSHPVTMVVPPDVRAIVVGNDKVRAWRRGSEGKCFFLLVSCSSPVFAPDGFSLIPLIDRAALQTPGFNVDVPGLS